MTRYILLILSIVLLSQHINTLRHPRILNGRDANIEDFPYQVSIREDNIHFCGGAIISERHILTAAHCFFEIEPDEIEVFTSTSFVTKEGNTHEVIKITSHPDYRFDQNPNDIAVITLKDRIQFDKYQQRIKLPDRDFEAGSKANLTGWGYTDPDTLTNPDNLQKLEATIISLEECRKKETDSEITKIHDTEVCTINDVGAGACTGDSGGPLAVNNVLVGVISRTLEEDSCGDGNPVIYSNVFKFKSFIESAMNKTV